MKTAILFLMLVGECCAATISDTAFLYDLSHTNDTNVRPTNEAIHQFPDLSVSGAGVTLRYRFNTAQAVLDGIAPAADSSIDAYLAQPGDAFSRYGIAAGKFPVIIERSASRPQLSVGEEFYVGMAAGLSGRRTHYGWAHFRRVNGLITVVDQTWAMRSDGIVVGTRVIVPEPATVLLLIGSLLCSWRLRREGAGRLVLIAS